MGKKLLWVLGIFVFIEVLFMIFVGGGLFRWIWSKKNGVSIGGVLPTGTTATPTPSSPSPNVVAGGPPTWL